MPKMVELEVNPMFHPSDDEQRTAIKGIKASKMKEMPYITAMENIRHSKGMLRMKVKDPDLPVKINTSLEDMTNDQLLMMMLTLGMKPRKQMKKADILKAIRSKMANVEIVDE